LAECFRRDGYETCLTPATRDGGRDVIAVLPGTLPVLVVAEAKKMRLVEPALVHSLVAVRDRDNAHMGLIATTGRFSQRTKDEVFRKWKRWVELRDGEQFIAWIQSLRKKTPWK
jgi:HJR/Mrr/RecB family endonuclease